MPIRAKEKPPSREALRALSFLYCRLWFALVAIARERIGVPVVNFLFSTSVAYVIEIGGRAIDTKTKFL